ncbi:MAG: hypothetical protein EA377_07945 [Phycisphaerales bacterium]|nr:MAG: hypothetical protein EA377_07945 [Phycisphaerales bacterium]
MTAILASEMSGEPIALPPFEVRHAMRLVKPRSANQLHGYVRSVLGFSMPRHPIVRGHTAPFAYLEHAYFERCTPRDCLVWANRGGGKTQLGAIATLLDLLFKPGIQIRILGGSLEQSSKMYRYLKRLLESELFHDLIAGNLTERGVELLNGSRVEVLAQSERAVRGQRVHKLRCDEVELFEPEIWDAAQLVTRSGTCGETFVAGAIETLSTMHRPFGLMQSLLDRARAQNRRVFRWSVLDTLERCPPQRPCESCLLWHECGGRAKRASGFIAIDDAIQQKRRVDESTWASEMLCDRPRRDENVFPEFDEAVHVRAFEPPSGALWIGGMDFGYRAPTVLLWACLTAEDELLIVDEHAERELTTDEHIAVVRGRSWPRLRWIGADPAGHQRSEQTGVSTIALWKRAGFRIRTRPLPIEVGILAVRRRLRRADGVVTLRIHPRCRTMIESMHKYRYPPNDPEATVPMKDGTDHAADALRYLISNLDRDVCRARVSSYLRR